MKDLLHLFHPNEAMSKKSFFTLSILYLVLFLVGWVLFAPPILPKPLELIPALRDLVQEGMFKDIMLSMGTVVEVITITSCLTFVLAVSTALPLMRPIARFVSTFRFISFTGFTFLFTILWGGGHELKIALLVFGTGSYMLTSFMGVINNIPSSAYDHARTLGLNEWEVTWEVVVLGHKDQFMDAVRQNGAICIMLVPVVEKLVMSEGGFGALLFTEERHHNLAEIIALQSVAYVFALIFDYGMGVIRLLTCPYVRFKVGEKR